MVKVPEGIETSPDDEMDIRLSDNEALVSLFVELLREIQY